MARPSLSAPEWMLIEIEERREKGTNRSEWIREAVMARLIAEDNGEWETPEVEQPSRPEPVDA